MIASSNRRRVVVTGVGVINPLGNDIETVWSAIKEGKSGVGYTTIFDASKFPTRISAEIKDWDIANHVEDPELWKFRGRHSRFAAGAAMQAFEASGVEDFIKDRRRFGVYMGSGEGNQDFMSFASMMAKSLDGEGNLDLVKFTRAGLDTLNP
ncbi:MAG: beta-ketoacyl synthase N-terminal-like domain-containing protein, partial [Mariniblastus sp.]|nr:beta-ketoacyl synthase N-terminal-like domain-containing protein [Mariniblastus sp.]